MTGEFVVGQPFRITTSPPAHWSRYPSLIRDRSGDYCLAWYRYPPPASGLPCQIFFCKNGPRLDSISGVAPTQVTQDDRNHSGAVLWEGAGAYWMAWHCWPAAEGPRFLLFTRSRNGQDWSTPARPLPQMREYMIHPSAAWHPSRGFRLAFTAGMSPDSYIALSSSDDGLSWEAPRRLSIGSAADDKATLAIDGAGRMLLAWRCATSAGHGIRWSTSMDGERWDPPHEVDTHVREAQRPKLSVDAAGRVWLAYEGDGAIWLCRLQHGDASPPIAVSQGEFIESRPSALIANARGRYWMAWTSQRAGTEGALGR